MVAFDPDRLAGDDMGKILSPTASSCWTASNCMVSLNHGVANSFTSLRETAGDSFIRPDRLSKVICCSQLVAKASMGISARRSLLHGLEMEEPWSILFDGSRATFVNMHALKLSCVRCTTPFCVRCTQ